MAISSAPSSIASSTEITSTTTLADSTLDEIPSPFLKKPKIDLYKELGLDESLK